MLYSLLSNLLYTTWKCTARHPGSNQSSRTLRKSTMVTQPYDTSTKDPQLLWFRKSLKQRCLLWIHQPLMHFLPIKLSSFSLLPHEWLAPTALCSQDLHSPLYLPLHCPLLTSSDSHSNSTERRGASQSLSTLLTQLQVSCLTLFVAEVLTWLFFTRKLFHTLIILIDFYEPLSSCISFERKGRNCTVLKLRVHNGMCSKDILYLLTPVLVLWFPRSWEGPQPG